MVVVVVPRRRAPFKLSSSRKSLVLCCSSSFVGAVKFSSKVSVFFPTKERQKMASNVTLNQYTTKKEDVRFERSKKRKKKRGNTPAPKKQ